MSDNTPSREAIELSAEIENTTYGLYGPYFHDAAAPLIDAAFAPLREENKRLREALQDCFLWLNEDLRYSYKSETLGDLRNACRAVLSGKDSP